MKTTSLTSFKSMKNNRWQHLHAHNKTRTYTQKKYTTRPLPVNSRVTQARLTSLILLHSITITQTPPQKNLRTSSNLTQCQRKHPLQST